MEMFLTKLFGVAVTIIFAIVAIIIYTDMIHKNKDDEESEV